MFRIFVHSLRDCIRFVYEEVPTLIPYIHTLGNARIDVHVQWEVSAEFRLDGIYSGMTNTCRGTTMDMVT